MKKDRRTKMLKTKLQQKNREISVIKITFENRAILRT